MLEMLITARPGDLGHGLTVRRVLPFAKRRHVGPFVFMDHAGPVTLAPADRDTDRYGRKLRVVMRGGKSLGGMLVDEGLARPWIGHREPWC